MGRTGRFVWFELFTTDTADAPAFYNAVTGLGVQSWTEGNYIMFVGQGGPIGGLQELSAEAVKMGAPTHWMGYVSVADVDAAAARVVELGGEVLMPPTELPGAGAYALFMDPQGAAFGVHGGGDESETRAPALGDFGWAELMTSDPVAAWKFYSQLFGWEKTGAMEMGPGATYQMFGQAGQPDIGGIVKKPEEAPGSTWIYYNKVEDTDASFAKATARGAKVIYPPMDLPTSGRAALIVDPWATLFGMYSDTKPAA